MHVCDDDLELFRYMRDGVSRRERGSCCGGPDLVFIVRVVEFEHAGCVCKGIYVGARALEGGSTQGQLREVLVLGPLKD